jgi:hypothetical protein
VPSPSIEVSRISPAPRDSASRAHSTASLPVGVLPAVQKHFPTVLIALLGVNCDDDALHAELSGAFFDEVGCLKRGGVDENLVGARGEYSSHFIGGFEAAADGETE